eukprot:TRINITY_DN3513_c0_g1_i2.p1 TRINITY_DN3513_c0_g1~~TRINITY_DN3513_c0_g1_i2.p1  ORF type:complete len:472 (-),score=105.75 TRINITY_DN3513_c0_g1_i2:593-2008(-)
MSVQSLMEMWQRPMEAFALLQERFLWPKPSDLWEQKLAAVCEEQHASWRFCYQVMKKLSSAFAMAVCSLDEELQKPACVFFLIAKALKIIEEEVDLEDQTKKDILRNFNKYIYRPDFRVIGIGEDAEASLLENFDNVTQSFLHLPISYQDIISRMILRMGHGLCEYVDQPIVSIEDYDLYCHYAAGLVGVGLTRIMALSNLEDSSIADDERLANSMAVFLQKTVTIKDFYRNHLLGRDRIPLEIYRKYSTILGEFLEPSRHDKAIQFANEMIADCWKHIPDCIEYMGQITNQNIFAFCAIPQILATCTLCDIYGGNKPFVGPVYIRRGLKARLIWKVKCMSDYCDALEDCFGELFGKLAEDDPQAVLLQQRTTKCRQSIAENVGYSSSGPYYVALGLLLLSSLYLIQLRGTSRGSHHGPFGEESLVVHSPFAHLNLLSGDVVVFAGLWMFLLLIALASALTRDSPPELTIQ